MNKQILNKSYYQKHKERIKARQQARYQTQKQAQQEQTNPLYQAHNIQVLLSLKDYTELSTDKHKLWTEFCWTLQDLNKDGISDIIQIMKLRENADTLIRDYWTTAKQEQKQKSQSWNSLDYDEQQRLIKYWAKEKARKEHFLTNQLTELDNQGKNYEQEIELAKFHEEQGKQNCSCSACQEKKELRTKIKQDFWDSLPDAGREPCSECGQLVKELDEENGICKKCLANYE